MLVNIGRETTFLFSPFDFANFFIIRRLQEKTQLMQLKRVPFHVFDNRSTVLPFPGWVFFFFLIRMQIRRKKVLATEVIYSKAFCM